MKLDLTLFQPTPDEVAQAKETLKQASAGEARSKMASMVQFVTNHKEMSADAKKEILSSRGADRQAYLAKYVSYQIAKGKGRLTSWATHTTQREKNEGFYFWNDFQMKREVGPDCAAEWQQTLEWRKDKVSGKSDPHLRQYIVPIDWVVRQEADKEELSLGGEKTADKEDTILYGVESISSTLNHPNR